MIYMYIYTYIWTKNRYSVWVLLLIKHIQKHMNLENTFEVYYIIFLIYQYACEILRKTVICKFDFLGDGGSDLVSALHSRALSVFTDGNKKGCDYLFLHAILWLLRWHRLFFTLDIHQRISTVSVTETFNPHVEVWERVHGIEWLTIMDTYGTVNTE